MSKFEVGQEVIVNHDSNEYRDIPQGVRGTVAAYFDNAVHRYDVKLLSGRTIAVHEYELTAYTPTTTPPAATPASAEDAELVVVNGLPITSSDYWELKAENSRLQLWVEGQAAELAAARQRLLDATDTLTFTKSELAKIPAPITDTRYATEVINGVWAVVADALDSVLNAGVRAADRSLALEAENKRLRDTLEPFAEAWINVPFGLTSPLTVGAGVSIGLNTSHLEDAHTARYGLPATADAADGGEG